MDDANRWRGRTILFDVGSFNGKEFMQRAREDRSVVVFAFEPHPELYASIVEATMDLDNFHAYRYAVSDFNGRATFHISADRSCGSLREFDERVDESWEPHRVERWGRERTFFMIRQVEVEVVRLDTFMEARGIPRLDYLHVDAQGEDLSVLRSLGAQVNKVREGVLETTIVPEKPLYKAQPNKSECLAFLEGNGFLITRASPNGRAAGLEENIYFRRVAP